MFFELTNAPAIFQGYINKIFTEKLNVFIIVYLNNIFIYIKDNGKSHVQARGWVLDQLQKFLLYATLEKCGFHEEKFQFLCYIISLEDICMKDGRINAV